MKTIEEIRRKNIEILIEEAGSSTKLAAAMGKSDSQISQWAKGSLDSKTKKPRGISDDICREFEEKYKKPRGWMDNDHEASKPGSGESDIEEITMFLMALKQLSKTDRLDVLAYAQDMVRNNANGAGTIAANETQ
jgi:hypothetical protein